LHRASSQPYHLAFESIDLVSQLADRLRPAHKNMGSYEGGIESQCADRRIPRAHTDLEEETKTDGHRHQRNSHQDKCIARSPLACTTSIGPVLCCHRPAASNGLILRLVCGEPFRRGLCIAIEVRVLLTGFAP